MPTINVNKEEFFALLGRSFTEKELDELCFAYGLEYDGETSQQKMIANERATDKSGASAAHIAAASDETLLRIEVAANRYDLLSVEGLVLSLRSFLGLDSNPRSSSLAQGLPRPHFEALPPKTRLVVRSSVADVRPIIMCAVIRNIRFTPRSWASFIDLQDKLHHTLCKRRALASIGTHDLDHVTGPFVYEARKPEDIHFCPLRGTDGKVVNGRECLTALEKDLALRDYLPLIKDKERYPVVVDSKGEILSLPPIINGTVSKMSVDTRNVFIEVTATDRTKCEIVLQTVACLFSMYADPQFAIEQVEVVDEATGKTSITPSLAYRTQTASVDYINRSLGLSLSAQEQLKLLDKMGFSGAVVPKTETPTISIEVPPLRSDIMHECDVMEEVAIGYGFNNLTPRSCPTPTTGHQLTRTKIVDQLGHELSNAGFCEVMTFVLCRKADNYAALGRKDDGLSITLANSKSADIETARVTLLTGLLRTVANNKALPLPLRVFEIGETVVKDSSSPVGARNVQKLAALQCDVSSGFDHIHGLLDRTMQVLGVPPACVPNAPNPKKLAPYALRAAHDPAFIEGLSADVFVGDKKIGIIGVVAPPVLIALGIDNPCAAFEITLDFPMGV